MNNDINSNTNNINTTTNNNFKSSFNYEITMKKFAFKNKIPANNNSIKTVKIDLN